MANISPPGVAVAGTGFIGPVHIEALRRLGRPVVGVLGSAPEKSQAAARTLGIPRAYASFAELLADPAVGIVHLASPNRLHFEQCRQALAAGKHIICEKPLALTSVQTRELVALAEQAALVCAVNYNLRFYPLALEARQRIREGSLGRVYHVTGSYFQDWLLYDTDFNWRVMATEGGALRAMADIGTHWLDLITWITGLTVTSVCADLHTFVPVRQCPQGSVETFQGKLSAPCATQAVPITTEDYGAVLLRFHGGASGCFTVSQVAAGRKNALRYEIAGQQAALSWNSERPNELEIGHREKPNELLIRDPALLGDEARRFSSYPGGHNEGFADTFKGLFRAVYEAIEKDERSVTGLFPSFADGHREASLCEAILQSHQERRWVELPS